nr:transposase [Streptomyces sp. MBT84]
MLPRRTICCSFCPSWSVSLRTRTGSATAPPAVGTGVTAHPTATTANPANLSGHSTRKPGRPPIWTRRLLINGIRFRVRTGIPWRDRPDGYGP